MAAYESAKTTKLYDRTSDAMRLGLPRTTVRRLLDLATG